MQWLTFKKNGCGRVLESCSTVESSAAIQAAPFGQTISDEIDFLTEELLKCRRNSIRVFYRIFRCIPKVVELLALNYAFAILMLLSLKN